MLGFDFGWVGEVWVRGRWSLTTVAVALVGCSAPEANPGGGTARAVESAEVATIVTFPLRIAPGGRYLQDQNGVPFRVHGDTAWSMFTELDLAGVRRFLDDRRARGINTLRVQVSSPVKFDGAQSAPAAIGAGRTLPFRLNTSGGTWTGVFANHDPAFSSPNAAYWDWVDVVIREAFARGILLIADHAYMGFNNGAEGWWQEIGNSANTQAACFGFGQYLGARWKNHPNLMISLGTDMFPASGSESSARFLKILDGMQDAGCTQIVTAQYRRSSDALDFAAYGSRIQFNGVYPGGSGSTFTPDYARARSAYARNPAKPALILEAVYEDEIANSNYTRAQTRALAWWGHLSSIAGYVTGNSNIWKFVGNWDLSLDSPGIRDFQRTAQFFDSLAWWELVPEGLGSIGTLVTAGGGGNQALGAVGSHDGADGLDHVSAAATPTGSILVAYVPENHSGPVTMNMAKLSGSARARWFDPVSGAFATIGTFPNTGSRAFTIPGANSSGANDWVLLIDLATNSPPTIAAAATATPNPVTATTTSLTVLGADDGGEPGLTYSWATTGTPPAPVAFSANGTNAAKNVTATFTRAGGYALRVTASDAQGQTATSNVAVAVNQALGSVNVTPASVSVPIGATQQFSAVAWDQFGENLVSQPLFAWTVGGGGTISSTGLFSAGVAAGGPFTATATSGGRSGSASVTVTSGFSARINFQVSTTATPAGYSADAGLAYAARGSGLTYGWNSDNSFQARERNAPNSPDKRYDTLNHLQLVSNPGAFWEIAVPNGTYSVRIVAGDAGYIDSTYALLAESTLVASGTPTASQHWVDGTASVAVSDGRLTVGSAAGAVNNKICFIEISSGPPPNQPPTVAAAAAAAPNPATGTTTALSVLGADDGGESVLTYTWATTGAPPAAVQFSSNGTNAAKNATATFTKAGAYSLRASISDALGQVAASSLNVTVNQTFASVAVSPSSASVATGASQQFTALGRDQFGDGLSQQPTFSWTASGGGTVSSSGLFAAGLSSGGPFTITATSGARNGTASVTVTSVFSVKINFQIASTATPAGYLADTGLAYGMRGGGFTYGWNVDSTAQARERLAANSPDKRYDTLNHLQLPANPNAFWEIAVPNGSYRVRIVAGDPSYFDSIYALRAEASLVLSGTPSASQLWFDGTATVIVTDGRLTVASDTGATNNKICFIEITAN